MDTDLGALRRTADRSAAVAGLARTVQHDINNLLTVIFANLELLKRSAAEGAPQRQLGRVEEAARRFEGTSRAILALIRRPAGEVMPIRLTEALSAVQPLLQMILPAPGALALALADTDPPVLVERSALEEGLLALAQQIAETQPRGRALAITVAEDAAAGVLLLEWPAGIAPPALALLAATAAAAGGTPSTEAGSFRLHMPRHAG